jgi:hypothetical protein
VFVVLGGIGFFGYLGHLSWSVFANSFAFPFVLTQRWACWWFTPAGSIIANMNRSSDWFIN